MYLGGLVNVIPRNDVFETKNPADFSVEMLRNVELIKFPDFKEVKRNKFLFIGSYNLKIQPYFGDFDTLNYVEINGTRNTVLKIIVKGIKKVISDVQKLPNHFITDIKAGRYPDGESIHWSPEECLRGYREEGVPDFNGHTGKRITLEEAINQDPNKGTGNPLLKVDMVSPYFGKYIETTAVYAVKAIYDNYDFYSDIFSEKKRIILSIMKDAEKQLKNGKYFKVIKRLFAGIRLTKTLYGINESYKIVKPIIPLMASNISKLSSIASDLSTLYLLLQLNKKIDFNFASKEVEMMKDRVSNIMDLNINNKFFNNAFDKLNNLLNSRDKKNNKSIMNLIDEIIHNIYDINKEEITEYFRSLGTSLEDYMNLVDDYIKEYLKNKTK